MMMSTRWLSLCVLIAAAASSDSDSMSALRAQNQSDSATVTFHDGKPVLLPGVHPDRGLAWGTFTDSYRTLGWHQLSIETHRFDADSLYAAGFLEGALTHQPISDTLENAWNALLGDATSVPTGVARFMDEHMTWLQEQVAAHPTDDYWVRTGAIWQQFLGLLAGYNSKTAQPVSLHRMLLMQWDGDLGAVMDKLKIQSKSTLFRERRLRCSALVRVLPDHSDVFFGHTTWDVYQSMVRMWKSYSFGAQRVSFSSSPSWLSSIDDYYLTGANLAVAETTNGIYNDALLDFVRPQSVMSWMRAMHANFFATSGPSWAEMFSRHNSGTYNNQWIVFDNKLFTPSASAPLEKDLLWIVEQIPGFIESGDVTHVLREQSYWPSYNIPYFASIRNQSHFDKSGRFYSTAPRAKIFARNATQVTTLEEFGALLRYNDYQHDPLALGDPLNQISSRADLRQWYQIPLAFGGIDSKVTSARLIGQLVSMAENGPTHDQVPMFSWKNDEFAGVLHRGQPEKFDFQFERMEPAVLKA